MPSEHSQKKKKKKNAGLLPVLKLGEMKLFQLGKRYIIKNKKEIKICRPGQIQ